MSLEGPLLASPIPNLPSLSWGPPLPGKLPRPLLPFQIKSIPTLAPVNLPASRLTLPSTPTLSLFWSFSRPCPPPSSFTWMIPAYPPLTATGHHLTSGKPHHHHQPPCFFLWSVTRFSLYSSLPCGGSQSVSSYCPLRFLRLGTMPHPSLPNSQGSARILDQDLFGCGNLLRFRVVTSVGQSPSLPNYRAFNLRPWVRV